MRPHCSERRSARCRRPGASRPSPAAALAASPAAAALAAAALAAALAAAALAAALAAAAVAGGGAPPPSARARSSAA